MKAVIDSRTPQKTVSGLTSLGFEAIFLPPLPDLPSPVSAHPDMLLFFAENRYFVTKVICA